MQAILKNLLMVLPLDEATSALDVESERMVKAGLECATGYRTTLCVTHRLATVQRADRIVVTGTHAELLARRALCKVGDTAASMRLRTGADARDADVVAVRG